MHTIFGKVSSLQKYLLREQSYNASEFGPPSNKIHNFIIVFSNWIAAPVSVIIIILPSGRITVLGQFRGDGCTVRTLVFGVLMFYVVPDQIDIL